MSPLQDRISCVIKTRLWPPGDCHLCQAQTPWPGGYIPQGVLQPAMAGPGGGNVHEASAGAFHGCKPCCGSASVAPLPSGKPSFSDGVPLGSIGAGCGRCNCSTPGHPPVAVCGARGGSVGGIQTSLDDGCGGAFGKGASLGGGPAKGGIQGAPSVVIPPPPPALPVGSAEDAYRPPLA